MWNSKQMAGRVAALGGLLLFSTCFPKGPQTFYTCKACFVDNPSWCVVHEDGHGDFPAENERQAKAFAKYSLCSDSGFALYAACL